MDGRMNHDEPNEPRDRVRDELADWIGGRLAPARDEVVRRAVQADPDLAAEADLLRAVAAGRPPAPEGLAVRIAAAVLRDRRGPEAPTVAVRGGRDRRAWPGASGWALAAAAVLVLALGTLELVDRTGTGSTAEVDALVVALEGPHTPWVADDGTVAGAAVLGGLSEEALASLLEEMGG